MEEDNRMVLRTEDLVKKYGKRTVVSHVSINVKQGEIVGLLGPNGAGKTTSFYMTVGLITPNEGRIYLNDLDITNYPVYKRAQAGIGYLAQEASVFRQMSVEDNIMSVLEMTGKPLEYRKEKLESLLSEFRIQKVRKNKGNQLSGGERRRTEIARCLTAKQNGGIRKHKREASGVLCNGRIRRLTPRECLRLQGWKDERIDKVLAIQSDNQVYKQAGNGVTVNVVEAIGRRLAALDAELYGGEVPGP